MWTESVVVPRMILTFDLQGCKLKLEGFQPTDTVLSLRTSVMYRVGLSHFLVIVNGKPLRSDETASLQSVGVTEEVPIHLVPMMSRARTGNPASPKAPPSAGPSL